MTAIVGLVDNGVVYIGGDSAGVGGYAMTVRADSKVFRVGEYLLGFTSSFRMGQLLRYSLAVAPPTGDIERFMATTFIDAVRDCLKAGGYARKENEVESGGVFLVGVAGHLFKVGSDYQVGSPADGYEAAGCGADIACGALYATRGFGMPPMERVELALRAAERHSAGVRGPFVVLASGQSAAASDIGVVAEAS